MPDPTQNNQNTNQTPQTGTPSSDQTPPPAVPEFQVVDSSVTTPSMPTTTPPVVTPEETNKTEAKATTESVNTDSGSAAPITNDFSVTPPPKKKFGGGKIIATILGFLVLAGGIAGGVILTQQQQDIREKAYMPCEDDGDCDGGTCGAGGRCVNSSGDVIVNPDQRDDNTGGSTDTTPSECPANGRTCYGNSIPGTEDPCLNNGQLVYCCPVGKTNFNGACNAPPSGGCANDGQCANGYRCSNATCIPAGVSVGGAPVSCNRTCDTSDKVCEQPNARLECKTKDSAGNDFWCLIEANSPDCSGANERDDNESPTASCQNVKAYSQTWALLSAAQLSTQSVGSKVNFCVAGITTQGAFDRARFTINGTLQAETTATRPGSTNEFCQLYTIPAATTSFSISAQIHHPTLNWK